MNPVHVDSGDSPVILAMPHTGIHLPEATLATLNHRGLSLADTDWHIHTLYKDLLPGASVVRAMFHRYVIDANRDPDGSSLYPGANTTGLVPTTDFDGKPIWQDGREPDTNTIAQLTADWHAPYHQALQKEIDRVRQQYGMAIVYDCHSIRSRIPFLFDDVLPDFNIGTFDGASCSPLLTEAVQQICSEASDYSTVLNGRFKGGWTTRHYGQPDDNVHVIQMELAQSNYMLEESPWTYDPSKAESLRKPLAAILLAVQRLAPSLTSSH